MNGDNRVNDDATARRRQLGRTLRQARTDAGLTQEAVAERLGCRQAKINKIETTLVAISLAELDLLIGIYGVRAEKATELRQLAALDLQAGPVRTKYLTANSAFTDLSDLEPDATEICCWHSERLPGPLQSQPYLLEQHAHLITRTSDVVQLLRQWTARARVFTVATPPRYRAVISESSLHRMPARRPSLLADQVTHLVGLIDAHEKLDLRILPFGADVPYVETDFQILRFDKPGLSDFAYIEYPSGSRKFKTPAELAKFQDHWDQLNAAALTSAESRDFLSGLVKKDQIPPG